MKYNLNDNQGKGKQEKTSVISAVKKLWPLMEDEKKNIFLSLFAIIINSGLNLIAPFIVGFIIDQFIQNKDFGGVMMYGGLLLIIYLFAFGASFIQMRMMGSMAQRVLYKLRNAIFSKLQELPVAFFNQNKAGDLISRINNDTDNLNQFFSQSLMQFVGTLFTMTGAAIFILCIKPQLGAAALIPAVCLLVFTQLISGWVKKKNLVSLQSIGGMSAEIQESLNNFKVIVAFNRHDYFRDKFKETNDANFKASITAGIANNIFSPVYDFASNLALLIVFSYGIYLISIGNLTVGLLISFLIYVSRFYDPVRQLASLWSTFQVAMAAWDRISHIIAFESDLGVLPNDEKSEHKKTKDEEKPLLEFKKVGFHYPDGKAVLKDISFKLSAGKTYALVGPTGGGKTTTASLMARLYDPSEGQVLLDGKDMRSYEAADRTKKIGFILQEPYLFTGTVRENILYGNEEYMSYSNEKLEKVLEKAQLGKLLHRFDKGLETKVASSGDAISLGQRQLIAFIRAVLRNPELLILDEATANIDTVTEQLLEEILKKLPKETTKVIIAHRLNTIENADEIFFVNSGEITRAGSMEHAVEMLLHGKRKS